MMLGKQKCVFGPSSDCVLPAKCKKHITIKMKDLPFSKTCWKYSEFLRKCQDWIITDRFWTKKIASRKLMRIKSIKNAVKFMEQYEQCKDEEEAIAIISNYTCLFVGKRKAKAQAEIWLG